MIDFTKCKTNTGIMYFTIPSFEKMGVNILYPTKQRVLNGESHEINMIHKENVSEFLKHFGYSQEKLVTVNQVHGKKFIIVEKNGSILGDKNSSDGIISIDPGSILGIATADCLSIGLASPAKKVMALLHCGWRGLLAGMIQATIETMTKRYTVDPDGILVALGPSIEPCCYPVGEDVVKLFKDSVSGSYGLFARNESGEPCLDLKKTARHTLESCGINKNNIFSIDLCTSCNNELFYSYRRDKESCGRMMTFMTINI